MKFQSAFTPLRTSLMILIVLSNIMAIFSYMYSEQSWAYLVGIFATVFILMFVFLQILELIWLISFKKQQTNPETIKSYKKAINIYLILFPIGFFMAYLVLLA
jgi:hypothetical protein